MPTNVTPEYKRAKAAFQNARDPVEKLSCLKEMLRTVPKHKGTEHLQAEIKTKIKELSDELTGPRKGGARTGQVQVVRPEGAAQVALVGPPNSGKSSLHVRLTGSHAEVGPYPHTTRGPLPGMLPFEDVHFQLVDLPPMSASYVESWMPNALQVAHAVLLVVDPTATGCVENVIAIRARLEEKRVSLVDDWNGRLARGYLETDLGPVPTCEPAKREERSTIEADEADDLFRVRLPTLLVANKRDLGFDADEIEVLEELVGARFPAIAVSALTGEGLGRIGRLLFHGLDIIRVYTKIPGHPADMNRPYTLFAGGTVYDVARLVHREVADSFRFARVWGSGKFDGQQVGRDHVVHDRDVVELHV
jgi:ribosome-interacting GTPase 1